MLRNSTLESFGHICQTRQKYGHSARHSSLGGVHVGKPRPTLRVGLGAGEDRSRALDPHRHPTRRCAMPVAHDDLDRLRLGEQQPELTSRRESHGFPSAVSRCLGGDQEIRPDNASPRFWEFDHAVCVCNELLSHFPNQKFRIRESLLDQERAQTLVLQFRGQGPPQFGLRKWNQRAALHDANAPTSRRVLTIRYEGARLNAAWCRTARRMCWRDLRDRLPGPIGRCSILGSVGPPVGKNCE